MEERTGKSQEMPDLVERNKPIWTLLEEMRAESRFLSCHKLLERLNLRGADCLGSRCWGTRK